MGCSAGYKDDVRRTRGSGLHQGDNLGQLCGKESVLDDALEDRLVFAGLLRPSRGDQ